MRSGSGTFETCPPILRMSVHRGIVLQKSQKALLLIFRQSTKQAIVADQCGLKPATGIACEFGAWRRGPPHHFSIAAPTARRI
jgi:hypothetical protein